MAARTFESLSDEDQDVLTPGGLPQTLAVLVHQRGREIECSSTTSLRALEGACFHIRRDTGVVRGPYADLGHLFRSHGQVIAGSDEATVLLLEDWVVSVDRDGRLAGPYLGFDEWVWGEGSVVRRERGPTAHCLGMGNRYVHEWEGIYFLTVDPLPADARSFPSLDGALALLRSLPYLAQSARQG